MRYIYPNTDGSNYASKQYFTLMIRYTANIHCNTGVDIIFMMPSLVALCSDISMEIKSSQIRLIRCFI